MEETVTITKQEYQDLLAVVKAAMEFYNALRTASYKAY